MTYTEIQERNQKKYYYRVMSIREKSKISKKRIYLGVNLTKEQIREKELSADIQLLLLSTILTEEQTLTLEKLKRKREKLSYEAFISRFTHDSTHIEGNTFTLQETAQLLFEGMAPRKSLREINEITNHKEAFDYLLNTEDDISKKLLLELHSFVMKETLATELTPLIGKYRIMQVFIRGVKWLPSKAVDVPTEMAQLFSWYTKNKNKLHPLVLAAHFHVVFEMIHPFIDGNGRVGRLLLNFILHRNGFPMINIPHQKRHIYYKTLETAQVKGDLRPFVNFLYKLMCEEKISF